MGKMGTSEKHGPLRQHQAEGLSLADEIINRTRRQRDLVANITPGGGKTLLYSLLAHALLDAGIVQQAVILVPREALRSQVARDFTQPERGLFRRITEKKKDIRSGQLSTIERSGFVATYSAVVADPRLFLKRVSQVPTALFLDEPHHLVEVGDEESEEDAAWWAAVRPLTEAAKHNFLGSGTLWRHDGQRIPLVRYDDDRRPLADITYTRRDALRERAILPINFFRFDAHAKWAHRGRLHAVDLSEANRTQQPKALKTLLLDHEYRVKVALDFVQDWMDYRKTRYRSRAIIICHSQEAARSVCQSIRDLLSVDAVLAISQDSHSHRRIVAFRENGAGDVLVTVGMAYEGLDVPDCTHLLCLTNVRSEPWLEQAFARVTRINRACDRSWEEQCAFIYVPDDQKMRTLLDKLMDQQPPALIDHDPRGGVAAHRGKSTFRPLSAEAGMTSLQSLERSFSATEADIIRRTMARLPYLKHQTFPQILEIGSLINWSDASEPAVAAK